MSDFEQELENGEYEPEEELEDPFLGDILGEAEEEEELEDPFLGDILGGLLGEAEEEQEEELEDPFLGDIVGALPGIVSTIGGLFGGDGEMENLAEQALETENEDEAEAFIGALVPMATKLLPKLVPMAKKFIPKLLPKVAKGVNRVVPNLIKNVAKIGNKLRKSPRHRGKVRTLPAIVKRTVKTVGKAVAAGKPVTPVQAGKILKAHARHVWKRPALTKKVAVHCHRVAHRCRCAYARPVRVSVC